MKRFGIVLVVLSLLTSLAVTGGCRSAINGNHSYEIVCELEGNVLTGTEKVTYFNGTENCVSELKFNLFGNAFRKDAKYSPVSKQYQSNAYPNGINYGDMSVDRVTVDGSDVTFTVGGEDMNVLIVPLGKEVFPDEKVTAEISFKLTLANVVARTGYNDSTINLANFYPILCAMDEDGFYECVYYSNGDPFYSEVADYKVTLTADSNLVVASSGKVVSSKATGDKSTHFFEIKNARSFAFVLSEKFESVTDNSTGVEINYYFYDDQTPDKSLEYAVKSINTFNRKFGSYPYTTYSVVQTEFVQGGMEYPALVMISDELEDKAYGEVIVHETAHQWWQTAVGNNEIKYGFMDEGLAEYSVVLFYEENPEYGLTRSGLMQSACKTYEIFCTVFDKLYGNVDTTMLRSLNEYSSEYEYVNIAYIKGCIMFDYLRETIGDEAFYKGLKRYYSEYIFKNATPYDLAGVFEKIGADTNGFFDSFYLGKVIL